MSQIIKTHASEKIGTKFNVTQVAMMADGKRVVKLVPVSDTVNIENNALWSGAAKGKLEITVTNAEHSEFFVPGQSYFLQFVPIVEEADDSEQQSEGAKKELAGAGKKR